MTGTQGAGEEEQHFKSLAKRQEKGNLRACAARILSPASPIPVGFIIRSLMTDAIKKKLQDEINALEHELSHELPKELKKAVALGDLSENAEYHMAKQRQEFVKARLRQLGRRLADLSLTNMANIPKDKVGLGSTVKVYDNDKGEEIEYKLVTSEESDVAAGKISTTSPIGRALLNKKAGDSATVITPNGKRELDILSLSTIHDEAEVQ
jgi:transcription elongation factor GreA